MEDTERERFLAAVREGLADAEAGRLLDDEELEERLEAIYSILEERFESGETEVATRHDEHQP